MTEKNHSAEHFYGVDLLRGIAAIGIIVYHYFAFFHNNFGEPVAWAKSAQPLYKYLEPLYLHGLFFVQFFWVISGFVFAHVYAGSKTTAWSFVLRRFARLYPLHFVTLISITAFQGLSVILNDTTQVIGHYDLTHFIKHIFFLPSGGGYEYSFNSPIWSVNVEVAVYAVFFFMSAICLKRGGLVPIAMTLLCAPVAFMGDQANLFALCGFYFFVGCSLYCFIDKYRNYLPQLFILTFMFCWSSFYIITTIPGWAVKPTYFALPLAFAPPAVILAAAIDIKKYCYSLVKSLKWIGDATYSIYLWHFPVQVISLTFLNYYDIDRKFFTTPLALILWVAGMLLIAHLSFKFIEKPLQRMVMRAFSNKRVKEQTSSEIA